MDCAGTAGGGASAGSGAGGESKAKRVAVRYKPRVPLSTLSGDPKRLLAASIVQATWRGRLTREELYWEMMGYY